MAGREREYGGGTHTLQVVIYNQKNTAGMATRGHDEGKFNFSKVFV